MIKNIIENIKNCKSNVNWEKNETWEILPIFSELLDNIKKDLKKEAELQEEMIKAFIELLKSSIGHKKAIWGSMFKEKMFYNKEIKLLEKHYNKKWEEIIKDGE